MKRINTVLKSMLFVCSFMVSCTVPPPANDTPPTSYWPIPELAEQIETNYIPEILSDYVILDLGQRGVMMDSLERGWARMRLLLFEYKGKTKLYAFYTVDIDWPDLKAYRATVLDTMYCYPLSSWGCECILAVEDQGIEVSFYEKYVDSLWLIPATLDKEGGPKENKFPSLFLYQRRGERLRRAKFTPSDVAQHRSLKELTGLFTKKIDTDELFKSFFPPWPSDRLRLRAQGISYSSNGPRLFREENVINLDTASWIDLKGVSDRTLREIHHLTSLSLEQYKIPPEDYGPIPSNVHKLKRINLFIQTWGPEILPDSFRLLQNLDTLVISADARVPEQLDIILSLKKLRWLVFWQPYTAAEIRDIIAEMEETQNLASLQEVWFSCTDCYLENNADGVVETQNLASLPPRYIIKDYQAIKRKFGLID